MNFFMSWSTTAMHRAHFTGANDDKYFLHETELLSDFPVLWFGKYTPGCHSCLNCDCAKAGCLHEMFLAASSARFNAFPCRLPFRLKASVNFGDHWLV